MYENNRCKRAFLPGTCDPLLKNALASGEKAYTVMVDNVTAKENVSRFALHQGI